MVLNTSFNNISGICWLFVLLVEETGITTDLAEVSDKLFHKMLYPEHLAMRAIRNNIVKIFAFSIVFIFLISFYVLKIIN
jgi:hypothetical protein